MECSLGVLQKMVIILWNIQWGSGGGGGAELKLVSAAVDLRSDDF